MATQKIRVKIKAYDHALLDQAANRIIDAASKGGCKVVGPIPLPTKKEIVVLINRRRANTFKVLLSGCFLMY